MIRLSAFADEISPDLEEQIAVLSLEHIHFLDLRGAWNTNVLDLTDQQVARIKEMLDAHGDRVLYFADGAIKYFGLGSTWPLPPMLSSEMVQWAIQLILECSPKAVIECQRALWTTDLRPDVHTMTVPTLLIHREKDQNAPLDFCAGRTTQLIVGSELKVYEGAAHGLFLTHKDRLNADLLAFIQR